MNAEFKKEQNGTLFVGRGAAFGGVGGWVVPLGLPLKILTLCTPLFFVPPAGVLKLSSDHWFLIKTTTLEDFVAAAAAAAASVFWKKILVLVNLIPHG